MKAKEKFNVLELGLEELHALYAIDVQMLFDKGWTQMEL